jgi:hypothetical protein
MALLPPGFLLLFRRSERGGGFLKGGSEEGGLLELWLSLARRASSSWIRPSRCAVCAACSATWTRRAAFSARRRANSASGLSAKTVVG